MGGVDCCNKCSFEGLEFLKLLKKLVNKKIPCFKERKALNILIILV